MIDIILKPIFKVIFGIPIWITVKMAKLAQQFITELFTIMAFRALWYIRVIFWLFVLYGLVLLDPFIKPVLMEPELQPAGSWLYDFYNRGLIVIMGLGIAAYATANMRRRFRRVRLEVKFLSEGRSLLNQIGFGKGKGNNGDKNGNGDGVKPKKPRSKKERKDTTKPVNAEKLDVENTDLSMEQFLAAVGAQAQAEVDAMTSGKPLQRERQPWNLGPGKGRHSKSALELEEEAEKLVDDARSGTRRVRGKYKNNPRTRDEETDIFGDDNGD